MILWKKWNSLASTVRPMNTTSHPEPGSGTRINPTMTTIPPTMPTSTL